MKLVLVLVVLTNALFFVSCQNDGRYRPPTTTTRRPVYRTYRPFDPFSRNRGANDGRYTGGNDGRYRARNDGRYYGGNDGRYVHVDVKYQHTGDGDRGKYSHIGGPSGSGAGNRGGFGDGSGSNGGGDRDGAGDAQIIPAAPAPAPIPVLVPTTSAPTPPRRPTVQVASGPSGDGWKIIHLDNRMRPDGYNYLFETENGINAEESGRIETTADGGEGLRSTGFYQYVGDDGQVYRVDYVADSNGFVPQGDHIPKTPPAIEKLLQYLASQPQK